MKKLLTLGAMALALLATGCTDYRTIPPSKVGKVMDNSGISKEQYQPGTRDIGFARKTKKLVLLDVGVDLYPVTLKMNLADKQELTVELMVKTQLDLTNEDQVDAMFTMVTPRKVDDYTYNIPLSLLFNKLNRDLVERTMVEIITQYTLEGFQENRKKINDDIEKVLTSRFKKTPLLLYSASIKNVTYPPSYLGNTRDIKKAHMDAEKKERMEEAKRRKLLAEEITVEVEKRVRLAKAEALRLENIKVAAGLNPLLLEYQKLELEKQRLEVDMKMAEALAGSNNSVVYYPTGKRPDYIDFNMGTAKTK